MSRSPLAVAVADVHAALDSLDVPLAPEVLYSPVHHALKGRGKLWRPAIVLLTAEAFGGEEARARAMPAALATEVFHTFTLVHDDIMDKSATRRGAPTVYAKWGTSTAILAGDLLFSLAGDLLRRTQTDRLGDALGVYHAMVASLCEGQALDLAFETRHDVTPDDYLAMIDGKTGALLELAFDLGALVGGASGDQRRRLREASHALGRAFQLQDDVLDITATEAELGKPIGGDLREGKRTWLLLRAIEAAGEAEASGETGAAGDRAFFDGALDGGLAPEAVADARARMERLGVIAEASGEAQAYATRGEAGLDVLPPGDATDALRVLAHALATRGN